jgi:hypothetical protein
MGEELAEWLVIHARKQTGANLTFKLQLPLATRQYGLHLTTQPSRSWASRELIT